MHIDQTPTNLQYANRFGPGVVSLARKSMNAARPRDNGLAARYTQWFHDEALVGQPQITAPVMSGQPLVQIAEATKENLLLLGEDTHSFIVERLPKGHRLRKAVRANIMAPAPHLGACKFGEIVEGWSGEYCSVIQVHVANFHGALDTAPDAEFFRFASLDFDQMYYGVHMLVDRSGNCVDYDRTRGREGIAFKTRDVALALTSIASASTGLSLAALRNIAKSIPAR